MARPMRPRHLTLSALWKCLIICLPSQSSAPANDLERVLGLPIDALDMQMILRRIDAAATDRTSFFISTPNLNFLVNSRSDPEFRESVLDSDLSPADGMPIIGIARLIGSPVKQRVSGSDILRR